VPDASERRVRLAELVADCHDDLGLFHEAVLGRPPLFPLQERIADSVTRNRWTVVPTAHALGKTWLAPSIVLGWLYTRPRSIVLTTSPSNTQLVHALWGGIKAAHRASRFPLAGKPPEGIGSPQVLQVAPKWYAIGFSTKKSESFQGQRPDDGELLVVVDEASGVEDPIWHAIESLGASSHLVLGNPIRSRCHFRALYELASEGEPGYAQFRMDAFSSPHARLTTEEVVSRGLPRGLVDRSWIEDKRRKFGTSSLYWRTRVLALFPDEDFDQLLSTGWVRLAMEAERDADADGGLPYLAADVSKGTGRDRAVLGVGDALSLLDLVVDRELPLAGLAALIKRKSVEWRVPHDRITFDAGGWAGPDLTRYLEAEGILDAVPYYGSASGGVRYRNRRARSAWTLRQRLDPDRQVLVPVENRTGWTILDRARTADPPRSVTQRPWAIPAHVVGEHADELAAELAELRYSHDGPKIELEPKEKLVERLGHSPDLADMLVMMASLWDLP
jgi:hypothetical protein